MQAFNRWTKTTKADIEDVQDIMDLGTPLALWQDKHDRPILLPPADIYVCY